MQNSAGGSQSKIFRRFPENLGNLKKEEGQMAIICIMNSHVNNRAETD